jgi:arsenite transporter
MWKLLQTISKNLVLAIPTVMILGFVSGLLGDAAWLKSLIVPFTFLMVYPMMVTLKINQVFSGGDLKAQIATQLVNFAIVPFLAFGVAWIFFRDQPYMMLGIVLAGLVPTSGMTISWTGFSRGNLGAAINMTVIGLTAGSLATPFYVDWLLGRTVNVNLALVTRQVIVIVFLPMLLGYLTRQLFLKKFGPEEFRKTWAPRFPSLSTIGVLGIVAVAMALKARTIAAQPAIIGYIFIPLGLLYLINFCLSTLVGKLFFLRGDAIALVYGTVMRNLSIALAIAITTFGEKGADTALVIAAAYIIQVQAAAWYVRLTDRFFGPAKA